MDTHNPIIEENEPIKYKDAKFPQEYITANLREETFGDLVDIEIQSDHCECVYLTKENAINFAQNILAICG